MGSFLDKPKTEKTTERGVREGEDGFAYGMASMQGWRMEMEDAHTTVIKLPLDSLTLWSFFMVFDGHAGGKVAKEAGTKLLSSICEQQYFKENLKNNKDNIVTENKYCTESVSESIKCGFLQLDASLKEQEMTSGSTAVGVLITPAHFFYINCGDSRAIHVRKADAGASWEGLGNHQHSDYTIQALEVPRLERGDTVGDGGSMAERLKEYEERQIKEDSTQCVLEHSRNYVYFGTKDHKPVDKDEQERIENAGGIVLIQRINGALAVSRALGDFDYKRVESLPAKDQMVSPMPVVTCFDRAEPSTSLRDSYIVIACDGIFDAITNENLEKYITWKLSNGEHPERISKDCLDLCLQLGSRDNMTIIILKFKNGAPDACDDPEGDSHYSSIMQKTKNALKEHEEFCKEKGDPLFDDVTASENPIERLMAYVESEERQMHGYTRQPNSQPSGFYQHWVHTHAVPGGNIAGGYIQFKSNVESLHPVKEANLS